jgi:hypothetical protein
MQQTVPISVSVQCRPCCLLYMLHNASFTFNYCGVRADHWNQNIYLRHRCVASNPCTHYSVTVTIQREQLPDIIPNRLLKLMLGRVGTTPSKGLIVHISGRTIATDSSLPSHTEHGTRPRSASCRVPCSYPGLHSTGHRTLRTNRQRLLGHWRVGKWGTGHSKHGLGGALSLGMPGRKGPWRKSQTHPSARGPLASLLERGRWRTQNGGCSARDSQKVGSSLQQAVGSSPQKRR